MGVNTGITFSCHPNLFPKNLDQSLITEQAVLTLSGWKPLGDSVDLNGERFSIHLLDLPPRQVIHGIDEEQD